MTRKILLLLSILLLACNAPSLSQEPRTSISTSEDYIDAELRRKIDAVTPLPLPQRSVNESSLRDAQIVNLKGKVKLIIEFVEYLTDKAKLDKEEPTVQKKGRQISRESYYSEQGYSTKAIYFNDGSRFANSVTVYGYLDGAEVGKIRYFNRNTNANVQEQFGSNKIVCATESPYSSKFIKKYDKSNRIIELSSYSYRGNLQSRTVYSYDGNTITTSAYDGENKLTSWTVDLLDDKENLIQREEFTLDGYGNETSKRFKYRHDEFDALGNWIKRTTLQEMTKDGVAVYEPILIDYLKIVYY